jgi:hypothetical protein
MAASTHRSGEVAPSVDAVTDVLDHLTAPEVLHQPVEQGQARPHRTRHLICLGTLHTGAPLGRARTPSPGGCASSTSQRQSQR